MEAMEEQEVGAVGRVRWIAWAAALAALVALACGSQDGEGSAVGDVAAAAPPESRDPVVARCLDLAASEAWSEASEPCVEALEREPDDLRIRYALQQAQASPAGADGASETP